MMDGWTDGVRGGTLRFDDSAVRDCVDDKENGLSRR